MRGVHFLLLVAEAGHVAWKIGVAIGALLLGGCTVRTPDSSAANLSDPAPYVVPNEPLPIRPSSAAAELAVRHDQARHANSRKPMQVDGRLAQAAQKHADWMALNGMRHTGAGGSSPFSRIKAEGYDFSAAGENVAAGQVDPAAALRAWMSSPGHRANILNNEFTQAGYGVATGQNGTKYWCAVFARPR